MLYNFIFLSNVLFPPPSGVTSAGTLHCSSSSFFSKTWTLDSELDGGLDHGVLYVDPCPSPCLPELPSGGACYYCKVTTLCANLH